MKFPREQVYAELFALGCKVTGILTKSRRVVLWTKVPPEQQPAFYQAQGREIAIAEVRGIPTKWELYPEWYVYVNAGSDPNAIPTSVINPIVDQIEDIFKPRPSGVQTLGGLVSEARILGPVEVHDGGLEQQSIVIIPIRIVTT